MGVNDRLDSPSAGGTTHSETTCSRLHFLKRCRVFQSKHGNTVICVLDRDEKRDELTAQLMELSLLICTHTRNRYCMLIHGALAEKAGEGVILAGPGGIGKTTASRRLPPPWRSLCDDTALVVRDKRGTYWAHPWPTWSSFMFGGPGGTWDVQHAVPLAAILFLSQAHEDQLESLGRAQAVSWLVENAEQVSKPILRGLGTDEVRALRQQHFDNAVALARTLPCYRLSMSRAGNFWEKVEQVLAGQVMDALD